MENKNLTLYEKFRTVPESAKKKITGGRLNGFTDINPMWRIKMLTDEFGPVGVGWYYDIVDEKLEKGANDEIAAFVKINMFVKIGEDWSKPIPGIGGSMFVSKERNGMYTSDECFKMALTDAISTSCKALGIGADVYFEKDRTKYDSKETEPKQPENKEPEKVWLNKWRDKEKTTVLPFYTKIVLNARDKSMNVEDLKKYYKISTEVEKELKKDLE